MQVTFEEMTNKHHINSDFILSDAVTLVELNHPG